MKPDADSVMKVEGRAQVTQDDLGESWRKESP
jgi:hypothetical protein